VTALVRINKDAIKLGEPLPFSIYDANGTLLLKAGFVINVSRHLDHLAEEGYFSSEEVEQKNTSTPQARARYDLPPRAEAQSTFETVDLVKVRLSRVFDNYKGGKLHEEFVKKIEYLATEVQEACTHDTDAALANLHLDYSSNYAVVHHLLAAILCELIGKKLGVKDESRLVLIKAALTHDMGILDIQDGLERQSAPLRADQKERIHAHPDDGVEILRKLGVDNPIWLDAVRSHHERLDGSGYPRNLKDDQVTTATRILAVADIYSAMVRDRPYRKAMVSKDAMRQLLVAEGRKTDLRLIQMMIKEIGVFPPGTIVRLANGETGVVKQRQENSAHPIVCSFLRPCGVPMLNPVRRETTKDEFNIDGIMPFSNFTGSIALIRRLWTRD